jgi:peptidoglycan/LPS O-acetylase OafA/YrhL
MRIRVHTIARKQEYSRGVGGSFDLIRLAAATAVLVSHSVPLTTGNNVGEWMFVISKGRTTLGELAVDVFFVTSGFLVTGSLFRSSGLLDFAWRRVVRICPALIFVVLLTILVIGPTYSTISAFSYISSPTTYAYLLNGVFLYHSALPGVFASNPVAGAVNGSLWTLLYEVVCYICVASMIVFRRATNSLIIVAFILLSLGAIYEKWPIRFEHFFVLGSYFFAGASLYALRGKTPYNTFVLFASVVVCILTPLLGVAPLLSQGALAYACIWLGFQTTFEPPGDYSYGIYLWAFPVQQMAVSSLGAMPWWENTAISLPITVAIAYFSWTFIESKAMTFKNMVARFRTGSEDPVAERAS